MTVFFGEISSIFQSTYFDSDSEIIVGGDYIVHLDAVLDNSGGKTETKPSVKYLKYIMFSFNLEDVWRKRNSETRQFTWRQKRPLIQRRIDYWLISDDLQDEIDSTDIILSIKSDHSVIILHVDSLEVQPFGPSYWKFNSSLVEDDI